MTQTDYCLAKHTQHWPCAKETFCLLLECSINLCCFLLSRLLKLSLVTVLFYCGNYKVGFLIGDWIGCCLLPFGYFGVRSRISSFWRLFAGRLWSWGSRLACCRMVHCRSLRSKSCPSFPSNFDIVGSDGRALPPLSPDFRSSSLLYTSNAHKFSIS